MPKITQQVIEVLKKFEKPIYSTDFSGYETGQPLSDWADFWASGNFTYISEANTGTHKVGVKQCAYSMVSSGISVLTWDAVGAVDDSDIVIKVNNPLATTTNGLRVYSRVSGTTGTENAYFVGLRSETLTLNKYVNGAITPLISGSFDLPLNTNYYIRFQTVSTTIRVKIWAEDAVEPNEWKLTDTDAELTNGAVGFGAFDLVSDYSVDYFSCGLGSNEPIFPPNNFYDTNILNKFGLVDNEGLTTVELDTVTHAMGGSFGGDNKVLTGVKINHSGHTNDIRVAVYSGGDLSTGLNNATLLYDFGKVTSSTSPLELTIPLAERLSLIPINTPLWIIVKSSGAGFIVDTSAEPLKSGNFQIERGRTDTTAIVGTDADTAFPVTFPDTSSSFTSNWYDWEITLEEAIVADVVFSLPSGEYPPSTLITLTSDTPGIEIWYNDENWRGPFPNSPWSKLYTGPFPVFEARTINARGYRDDYYTSRLSTVVYTVGGATVGDTLSSDDGTWGFNPNEFQYTWYRDDVAIEGSINASSLYLTVLADAGTLVHCSVTAVNSEGSTSHDSNKVAIVGSTPPPVNTVLPLLTFSI